MEQEGQSPQAETPTGTGLGALQLTIAPDVVELSSAPTMKRPSTMIAQAPAVLDSKGGLQGLSRPTGLIRPALGHTQFESCSGFTEAIFGGHCQYIAGRESLSYNAVDIFPRRLPRVLLDTRPGFVESRVQKKPSGSTHCHELIVKVQHSLSSWGKGLEQLAPSGKLCFS